jgi:hypothetical protein
MALKKPATTDRSMDPIKLLVQSNLGKDETGEKSVQKSTKSLKAVELTTKEMAVFFINKIN